MRTETNVKREKEMTSRNENYEGKARYGDEENEKKR